MNYVVVRTPLRLCLGGGGTDLPSYSSRYGGLVVSAAITPAVTVAAQRTSAGGLHFLWDEGAEQVALPQDLRHPGLRELLRYVGCPEGLALWSASDVPIGTGLGGSGAFLVGVVHALRLLWETPASRLVLAETARYAEQTLLQRPIGPHDHYITALGGIQVLRIDTHGRVTAEALPCDRTAINVLGKDFRLFYSGRRRSAAEVLARQDAATRSGSPEALDALRATHALGERILDALQRSAWEELGPLTAEHWAAKVKLNPAATTPETDRWIAAAREAGATGCKLVGAGGGGYLLCICPDHSRDVVEAMHRMGLAELPFGLSLHGTRELP